MSVIIPMWELNEGAMPSVYFDLIKYKEINVRHHYLNQTVRNQRIHKAQCPSAQATSWPLFRGLRQIVLASVLFIMAARKQNNGGLWCKCQGRDHWHLLHCDCHHLLSRRPVSSRPVDMGDTERCGNRNTEGERDEAWDEEHWNGWGCQRPQAWGWDTEERKKKKLRGRRLVLRFRSKKKRPVVEEQWEVIQDVRGITIN